MPGHDGHRSEPGLTIALWIRSSLTPKATKHRQEVVEAYKGIYPRDGSPFPQDPGSSFTRLLPRLCVVNTPTATAVNVMAMVYGNRDDDSALAPELYAELLATVKRLEKHF
ncbi:hypothetical protein FNF28_04993 [Cafeteria roenbergensis]|uniref:Uncharacterized protein n=1 Tax=Cafeteria roenbergensis TaxID=33653 RepID=A0A5A8D834_CAFRO|nr:hypothetical protein FNF28_04993 [Cafeteria roenbergensis]